MILLTVYASKASGLTETLAGSLDSYGSVMLATQRKLTLSPLNEQQGRDFVVVSSPSVEELECARGVVVADGQSAPRRLRLNSGVVVVTDSDNRRMRRLLRTMPNPVVCCGMSARDTVSFSSITAERAMLCIQRTIPTLSGECVEPCEAVVELGGVEPRAAMYTVTAMLLCGCRPKDGRFVLSAGNSRQ